MATLCFILQRGLQPARAEDTGMASWSSRRQGTRSYPSWHPPQRVRASLPGWHLQHRARASAGQPRASPGRSRKGPAQKVLLYKGADTPDLTPFRIWKPGCTLCPACGSQRALMALSKLHRELCVHPKV